MDREKKFRAWDKVENKMISWETLCNQLSNLLNRINGGSNWIYQEYTGLKDKNGVEIYEGDLIQCTYCKKEYGEVYWYKEIPSFRIKWSDDDCGNARCNRIDNWATVSGNIFENKNLLK